MKNYPNQTVSIKEVLKDLKGLHPELMAAYKNLFRGTMSSGVLSTKQKELIALGIAIQTQCSDCIGFHVKYALENGATEEEIAETVGVAVLMGGGPALMYGTEALVAMRQFLTSGNLKTKAA